MRLPKAALNYSSREVAPEELILSNFILMKQYRAAAKNMQEQVEWAVLTAESQAVSSRYGMESRSHFRLIAVYVQEGHSIKLVHFQSTVLR